MQLNLNGELEQKEVEFLKGIGFDEADFVITEETENEDEVVVLSDKAKAAIQKALDNQLSYSQENSYPYLQNSGEGTIDEDLTQVVFEKALEMVQEIPEIARPTEQDLKNYLQVKVDVSGVEDENLIVDVSVAVSDLVFSTT